jgi:hypothetical protein
LGFSRDQGVENSNSPPKGLPLGPRTIKGEIRPQGFKALSRKVSKVRLRDFGKRPKILPREETLAISPTLIELISQQESEPRVHDHGTLFVFERGAIGIGYRLSLFLIFSCFPLGSYITISPLNIFKSLAGPPAIMEEFIVDPNKAFVLKAGGIVHRKDLNIFLGKVFSQNPPKPKEVPPYLEGCCWGMELGL